MEGNLKMRNGGCWSKKKGLVGQPYDMIWLGTESWGGRTRNAAIPNGEHRSLIRHCAPATKQELALADQ